MALEILTEIQKAETEARRITDAARADAKDALTLAQKNAAEALAAAQAEAKKQSAEKQQQAEAEAEAEAKVLRESTENQCAAMRARAEARMEHAAEQILQAVIGA